MNPNRTARLSRVAESMSHSPYNEPVYKGGIDAPERKETALLDAKACRTPPTSRSAAATRSNARAKGLTTVTSSHLVWPNKLSEWLGVTHSLWEY